MLLFSVFSALGGKPITPTEDRTIGNGNAQHGDDNCNGASTAIGESVTKTNVSPGLSSARSIIQMVTKGIFKETNESSETVAIDGVTESPESSAEHS